MNDRPFLPRILVIDDLFGRTHLDRRNEERANLCGEYLIEDITDDEIGKGTPQKIKKPVAHAYFCRGQRPICSRVGDTVENDLEGTLRVIRDGWIEWQPDKPRWAMILLDLCFYTGRVTEESNRKTLGMPEARDGDDNPRHYFGLRILEAIDREFPDLPVIIFSTMPREEVSREFSYRGALGFLPRDDEHSPELLQAYIRRHGLIPDDTGEVIGYSKALLLALRAARRAAEDEDRKNILIRGERGAGKDLLAQYIHRHQNQKNRPFVVVNSSVLTPELFASELFGIENRVATGVDRREGLIKKADGGDLFLDEIRDMLPQVQAGILRVLEERKITPVGATVPQSVDVRFLSATNIDIEALAATDRFRSDLLDRLRQGGTIFLPPLRERVEDIPLLVEKFVRDAERANRNALRRQIHPEALDLLCNHDWPGNIRELENCIVHAVNYNPDVEYLVPVHIQLPSVRESNSSVVVAPTAISPISSGHLEADNLDGLIRDLDNFAFDATKPERLRGLMPAIQRLIARYLKAALLATRDPITDQIYITTAYRLMFNVRSKPKKSGLNDTQKGADLMKRIKGLVDRSPEDVESLFSDPILKEAYERAVRTRPPQSKKKRW